jgi:hydrogenase expression/formation protein HypC
VCLAIPGQVIEVVDGANRLALVDVAGVKRTVNIGLLARATLKLHTPTGLA